MARVSPDDFSDAAFPFGTSREIDLGYARVRASRLTYVGELGYELYVETEFAAHVYEVLAEAGQDLGLKPAGFFALNSLRMEKGYRHWGHDIGEEDTPYQAGLGFAVALDKPGGFIGREALMRKKSEGLLARRMVQVRLQDKIHPPLMFHHEPILRDGKIVGSIMSGAYGHRVGASLGLGYVSVDGGVTSEWLKSGRFEVEIAMNRHAAELQFGPWYDPKGERIRV
jgi:4-methylaminobutanoate oxidase (formaldehyde-forming)